MSDASQNPPVDPTPTPDPSLTSTPSPSPSDPNPNPSPDPKAPPKSLINEDDAAPPAPRTAPDKYEAFTLPEGVKLNDESLAKAHDLFKNLALDQPGAQSLIDFHTAELARVAKAASEAGEDSFRATVEEWGTKLKADPEVGAHLKKVKENLGKAYDVIINAVPEKAAESRALVAEFKSIVDITGAGNHPAFVKLFNRLAEMVIEPGHVAGANPSPRGQGNANGGNPGLAASMYGQPKP